MYDELVHGILTALPDCVTRIVLYGSVARGTNTPDSDVDIAVFISSRIDRHAEDRLSDVVVDMNLKYDKVFSVVNYSRLKSRVVHKIFRLKPSTTALPFDFR